MDFRELSKLAYDLRKDTVDMIVAGKGGHIGGDMSVMETLVTLYFDQMNISPENMNDPDRDLFVMSKGHSVEAYYAVLAKKGFLDIKEVNEKFSKFGTQYIGHPNNKLPGIEMNSGSLGHGLPVCVGMALAGKMDEKDYRVYALCGDGEIQEGQIWEAAMFAGYRKLDNLVVIVDLNGLQIDGAISEICDPEPLDKKFEAFRFHTITIDGNDFEQIAKAFEEARATKGMPTAIIAKTVKGKGVSFMENAVNWHGVAPNDEQFEIAMQELEKAGEALCQK